MYKRQPQDNIVLSLFPFASPYQMLSAAVENSRTALFLSLIHIYGKWVMFEPTDTYEFDDYMKLLAIKRKPNRK